MDKNKLVKHACTLDGVAKIGGKAILVACIVCTVFAVLVLVLGNSVIKPDFMLELDFLTLHLAEEYQQDTPLMHTYIALGLLTAAVCLFCVQHGMKILRRILAPMKEGKPFAEDTPLNIGKLAWLVFIGGTIMQVLSVASQVVLLLTIPLDQIFNSSSITGFDVDFQIDFGFVVVFIALRLMAFVFAYGHVLQRQSDETL